MKRVWTVLLALLVVTGLCGCAGDDRDAMYIEPARLTEEEKNLADLLEMDAKQRIFDFSLDDTARSIQVNVYQLTSGAWSLQSGGELAFDDERGRIALTFDRLSEGLRVAVQSENTGGFTAYEKETGIGEENSLGTGTAALTARTDIEYEKEIPLAIQVMTSKNAITLYGMEPFERPEKYEECGYEYVYAITVKFSQNPLS